MQQDPNVRAWYQNGDIHRIDGPAVIYDDDDDSTVEMSQTEISEYLQYTTAHITFWNSVDAERN
jgi:hypothetical protein